MKVRDLKDILMTGSNQIFMRDPDCSTELHVITTFCEFDELMEHLLNSDVVAIYPQSNSECHIEIR